MSSSDEVKRTRRWVFTIQRKYSDAAKTILLSLAEQKAWCLEQLELLKAGLEKYKVTYMVVGLEQGKKESNWHLQGYLEVKGLITYDRLKKYLANGSCKHMPARGTAEQSLKYCTKVLKEDPDAVVFIHGVPAPVEQGRRTDLIKVGLELLEHKNPSRIIETRPDLWIRHHRGFESLLQNQRGPARERPYPVVYRAHGPYGKGKSYSARHLLSFLVQRGDIADYYVVKDNDSGWFGNYRGQECIYFEEFRGRFPIDDMLAVVDLGEGDATIKGGQVPLHAHTFVFTSNSPLEDFYQGSEQHGSWLRRVCREYPDPDNPGLMKVNPGVRDLPMLDLPPLPTAQQLPPPVEYGDFAAFAAKRDLEQSLLPRSRRVACSVGQAAAAPPPSSPSHIPADAAEELDDNPDADFFMGCVASPLSDQGVNSPTIEASEDRGGEGEGRKPRSPYRGLSRSPSPVGSLVDGRGGRGVRRGVNVRRPTGQGTRRRQAAYIRHVSHLAQSRSSSSKYAYLRGEVDVEATVSRAKSRSPSPECPSEDDDKSL